METNIRKILQRSIGILFFVFIAIFTYGRYGRYITGPYLESVSLDSYSAIDTLALPIEGTAKNTIRISVNNRDIFMDQDGSFTDMVVLVPKTNQVNILLEDVFGKQKEYTYTIYSNTETDTYVPTLEILLAETEESDTETEDIPETESLTIN